MHRIASHILRLFELKVTFQQISFERSTKLGYQRKQTVMFEIQIPCLLRILYSMKFIEWKILSESATY